MGILADQALERLRRVITAQGVRPETVRFSTDVATGFVRGLIIILAFALLTSAAIFVSPSVRLSTPKAPEEVEQAAAAATGRASYPLGDGKMCRELVFNRERGDIVSSNTAPCDTIARKPYVEPTHREGAWNGFQWGGGKQQR